MLYKVISWSCILFVIFAILGVFFFYDVNDKSLAMHLFSVADQFIDQLHKDGYLPTADKVCQILKEYCPSSH